MSIQRVYIVRHGETDYNVQHRWQGHLDVPLNPFGKQQAQSLANYCANIALDAIFSSDLERAMATVNPLAKHKNLSISTDKRLREVHLGIFQGLKRAEIHEAYPHEAMRWDNDDRFIIPNGESRNQVQKRMISAWQAITSQSNFTNIMIVSHGGSLRLLMKKLFPDRIEHMHFANTSITIVDRIAPKKWDVVAINTTPHL
ncbi:MAG: histidine phosphatase family protein [Phototrophicaceae bacterium]